MPRYLLELYTPQPEYQETTARVRAIGEAEGSVRYVRTMFVAEDELSFHIFEAASREALFEAVRKSDLADARITEAVESATQEETGAS